MGLTNLSTIELPDSLNTIYHYVYYSPADGIWQDGWWRYRPYAFGAFRASGLTNIIWNNVTYTASSNQSPGFILDFRNTSSTCESYAFYGTVFNLADPDEPPLAFAPAVDDINPDIITPSLQDDTTPSPQEDEPIFQLKMAIPTRRNMNRMRFI
jgi:hypothetical protein